ncbi:MAG: T9SS type A sorting domain-containing protein, partial [Candidatus Kapaibacterium sp.]
MLNYDNLILNDKLLFVDNSTYPYKDIYITDGTIEGTVNLTVGIEKLRVDLAIFFRMKDKIYFYAKNSTGQESLWYTDGTPEGTDRLINLTELNESKYLLIRTIDGYKDYFYFRTYNPEIGTSYWSSDGTSEGTEKITIEKSSDILHAIASFRNLFIFQLKENGNNVGYYIDRSKSKEFIPLGLKYFDSNLIYNDNAISFTLSGNSKYSLASLNGITNEVKILNNNFKDNDHYSTIYKRENNIIYLREDPNASSEVVTWIYDLESNNYQLIKPSSISNQLNYVFLNLKSYKGYTYFLADYDGSGVKLYRLKNPITSVEVSEQADLLTVYPNPAKDYIRIEIDKPMQLSIISSTGAEVKNCGIVSDGKIEVSELLLGVYF